MASPTTVAHLACSLKVAAHTATVASHAMSDMHGSHGGFSISREDGFKRHVGLAKDASRHGTPRIGTPFKEKAVWPDGRGDVVDVLGRHAAPVMPNQVRAARAGRTRPAAATGQKSRRQSAGG